MLPLRVAADLKITLGNASVNLTPSQGLRVAEQLIRKATRRMMVEEALVDRPAPRLVRSSRRGVG